jgi:hypothetical protein
MSEYQGYAIEKNPETGRWQISWKGKKPAVDFREGIGSGGVDRRAISVA